MPKLVITEPHRLTRDEALKRIKKLLNQVKTEYSDWISSLREEWYGSSGEFSFRATGFNVSGTLTVTDHDVTVEGNLPLLVGVFKGKIETAIRKKARQLLT